MADAGIGRLLIASLHQGIAEVAPSRLEFYEDWLSPTGLSGGRMGLAPLGAVLSFLHREPPPANLDIVNQAGISAAEWAHEGISGVRKGFISRLPRGLRTRSGLRLGSALARETISPSKVTWRLRNGRAEVQIRSAIFEYLRPSSSEPMRRYYAAAFVRCLRLCDIEASVDVDDEAEGCRLMIVVLGAPTRDQSLLDIA